MIEAQCPRCKQPVDSQALNCPNCHNTLKAFGHPGIPLYQSEDRSYLCDRCIYDRDDSCNYDKRPYAQSCTLFHDFTLPLIPEVATGHPIVGWHGIKNFLDRYRGIMAIALLVIASVVLALNTQ